MKIYKGYLMTFFLVFSLAGVNIKRPLAALPNPASPSAARAIAPFEVEEIENLTSLSEAEDGLVRPDINHRFSGDHDHAYVVQGDISGVVGYGLVYTRVPRDMTKISCCDDASLYDSFTDVSRVFFSVSESDVVYDDLSGNVPIVIENCTADDERDCSAMEARVNPSGTEVIYSVMFGYVQAGSVNSKLKWSTSARLYRYIIATGEKIALPHTPGTWDRSPEWISDNEIVFSSSRANVYPTPSAVSLHRGTSQFGVSRKGLSVGTNYDDPYSKVPGKAYPSLQIWKMNIDGSNAVNLTPHETMALRPYVDKEGDILFSCWETLGQKTATSFTAITQTTVTNLFWICRIDQNGADQTSLLGAHRATFPNAMSASGKAVGSDPLALRSIVDDSKGNHYATSYYRGNHNGAGWILRWKNPVPHVEGCSTANCDGVSSAGSGGFQQLDNFMNVTPYGQGQDRSTQRHAALKGPNGLLKVMGKAGYPVFAPGDQLIVSHGKGWCYSGSAPVPGTTAFLGDEPMCDFGIRKVLTMPVSDPFDTTQMQVLVDSDQYHEFDADIVAPYEDVYGIPEPKKQPPLKGTDCYLSVVDAKEHEIFPRKSYEFAKNYADCAKQGCMQGHDVIDFSHEIAALRIYETPMWKSRQDRADYLGTMYNEVRLIGDAAIQADGSVRMRVPCDTPFIMGGVNTAGELIVQDTMTHSLRPGEERFCHGCHDVHSNERWQAIGEIPASDRFATTIAAGLDPIEPIKPYEYLTFTKDILPIIEDRCEICHTEFTPLKKNGLLWDALVQDYQGWDLSSYQPVTGGNGSLVRPIVNVNILSSGAGYKVGESLNFSNSPDGTGAAGAVAEVGVGGQITRISMTSGGSNYGSDVVVFVDTIGGTDASLTGLRNQQNLSRPYYGHWVNRFARDSILYWKCVNERMDGRTDDLYGDDMDFGPNHPTTATASECATIARWIDSGAQEKSGFLHPVTFPPPDNSDAN